MFAVQLVPPVRHWHAGCVLHAVSEQSILLLQLSSRPLPQISDAPLQSSAQVEQFSPPPQTASPQQ